LRKPPKGIYLNYDELVNLAEFDYNFTFETLDKKLISLKQEVNISHVERQFICFGLNLIYAIN
jgi:hypothetical protein